MGGPQQRDGEGAVLVVFNPAAGGGRADRFRIPLRQALDDAPTTIHWVESEHRGHAEELVRQWRGAVERVIAVGGDGTVHEVVNGLLDVDDLAAPEPRGTEVALGVVHLGTGGDFRRALHATAGWRDQLETALTAEPAAIDVLLVEVEGVDGATRRRISVNVAGAGMNGRVVELVNASSKEWGGLAAFATATVRAVIERRLADVEVDWTGPDGVQRWEGRLAASFFANGPYCGNGMWLGRGGSMRDGLLDMTLIPDLPALRMLLNVPRLYAGTADRIREVVRAPVSMVTMSSPDPSVMVDLDGELAGRLPLKIRVIERILPVAAGTADF